MAITKFGTAVENLQFYVGKPLYWVNVYGSTPRIQEYTIYSIQVFKSTVRFYIDKDSDGGNFFTSAHLGSSLFFEKKEAEFVLKIIAEKKLTPEKIEIEFEVKDE